MEVAHATPTFLKGIIELVTNGDLAVNTYRHNFHDPKRNSLAS